MENIKIILVERQQSIFLWLLIFRHRLIGRWDQLKKLIHSLLVVWQGTKFNDCCRGISCWWSMCSAREVSQWRRFLRCSSLVSSCQKFPLGIPLIGGRMRVRTLYSGFVCMWGGGAKYQAVWGGLGLALSYGEIAATGQSWPDGRILLLVFWPSQDGISKPAIETWILLVWCSSFLRTWMSREFPCGSHQPHTPFGTSGTLRILLEAFKFFFSNILSHACVFLSKLTMFLSDNKVGLGNSEYFNTFWILNFIGVQLYLHG